MRKLLITLVLCLPVVGLAEGWTSSDKNPMSIYLENWAAVKKMLGHEDNDWNYPWPAEAIGNQWQFEMVDFSRRMAQADGRSDLFLYTHCLNDSRNFVTWDILVGSYQWAYHDDNVVWYYPQWDTKLKLDLKPIFCEEKPGTGGQYLCSWSIPQGNEQLGFNKAEHTNPRDGHRSFKCWARNWVVDL